MRPFHGVTYDPAAVDVAAAVCPPYDVVNPHQAVGYRGRSARNFVRVVLNDAEGDDRYRAAATILGAMLDEGTLRRSARPAFYVHRQTFQLIAGGTVSRTGVIAAVRLTPWDSGDVRPHEHTMPGPKADRLRLMRATQADLEPIWVFHPDADGTVRHLLSRMTAAAPLLDVQFRAEPLGREAVATERHEMWEVSDTPDVALLGEALGRAQLYIADGHHRYETALAHAAETGGGDDDATRFKVMLLSAMEDPNLLVLPTHRLIRVPSGRSLGAMLAGLRERGWVTEQPAGFAALAARLAHPAAPGRVGFGLFAERRYGYYEGPVDAATGLPPSLAELDVAQVHAAVLDPLLGIGEAELAAGQAVAYSRDEDEVRDRVRSDEFDLGIFLRAPTVAQVRAVADAGLSMPRKSTYFWPKPVSGLVLALQRPEDPL